MRIKEYNNVNLYVMEIIGKAVVTTTNSSSKEMTTITSLEKTNKLKYIVEHYISMK